MKKFLPVFLTSFLILAGCAAPSTKVDVLMPAKQPSMVKAKTLGVANLKGDQYGTVSDRLRLLVANINLSGVPYYTLVDLDRKAILEEQKLSDSGLSSADTQVNLGELTVADTILGGSTQPPSYTVDEKTVQKNYCSLKNSDGACVETKTKNIKCKTQQSSTTLNLRATNVESGRIGFAKTYTASSDNYYCDEPTTDNAVISFLQVVTQKRVDPEVLKKKVLDNVMQQVRVDIAPYKVTVDFKFMKKDDSVTGSALTAFDSGAAFIKDGNVERGCSFYREAAGRSNNAVPVIFNVGICSEIEGNLDDASAFYSKANSLLRRPNKLVSEALRRISKSKARAKSLEQQMRN